MKGVAFMLKVIHLFSWIGLFVLALVFLVLIFVSFGANPPFWWFKKNPKSLESSEPPLPP